MQVKKLHSLIFSVTLLIFLMIGGFSSSSSVAIDPVKSVSSSLVSQNPEGEFVLPPLPYAYDALNTYIDSQTMTLHHDKHHAGYVKNLNKAIALHPDLIGIPVEDLLLDIDTIPEDILTTVINNGGGHANHSLFWSIMTPNSMGKPQGEIATAIDDTFGDFVTFQEEFNTAGKKRFGSGWAWLVMNEEGELEVMSTANQDSPFMEGKYPIMGNDVWEHAYYLKYQNKRGDYLDAWWNVVDWEEVNRRFLAAQEFFA